MEPVDRAGALLPALAARGGPRPPAVQWPASIVSTSDRLKALARGGAPEWTVVLADEQTGGRGREGRTWVSPPGSLYLSVLLRPRFPGVGLLPLAAGVAVAEAVDELGVRTELKWPNDVLAGGRKLAGILCEAASGPAGVEWVVLGVGVNVTLDPALLPDAIRESVTSLAALGRGGTALPEVAASVLARLARAYIGLESDPGALVAAWRRRAVPWWGRVVEARTAGGPARGRLLDVDDDGALVLELDGGGKLRLLSGEVSRVRPGAGG
jgi:BirA family biotin operon repressor/biotin-[acetyl-CoA-carboxylase] ligase